MMVPEYDGYGEIFDVVGALPVEAVFAERELYIDERVSIEGTVHAVCQQAGCWLMLRSVGGEDLRVDVQRTAGGTYAFTVPPDISGRRAVVRGLLVVSSLSEAEEEHLAMEGGKGASLALSAEGIMIAKG